MDDFAVIYEILRMLRDAMDYDEFDRSRLNAEKFNIRPKRLENILALLADSGYVTGISVTSYDNQRDVRVLNPRITLSGLEYLRDNSLMRRAARATKGIKDVIPGM